LTRDGDAANITSMISNVLKKTACATDALALAVWLLFNGERMWNDIRMHYSLLNEGFDMEEQFEVKTAEVDGKIYWIKDNSQLMYTEVIDGVPDRDNAKPFEADESIPIEDLMWMFDMLDTLKD
jgi:hypothetical protein